MKNLISVIIPVYNSEDYISVCLHSVTEQTYPHLEILVIDDGSEDNTPTLCRQIAEGDKRIKIYRQTNQGVSAARNRGIDLAEGEFLVFLDSDDMLHPRFLEKALERAVQTGADMVSGRLVKIPSEDMRTESGNCFRQFWTKPWTDIPADRILSQFHEKEELDLYTAACKLIKKALIGTLRFEEQILLGEDTLFMYQLVRKRFSLTFTGAPWYLYRMRTGSATHNWNYIKNPDPYGVHIRIRDAEYKEGRYSYAAIWERRYLLLLKEKFFHARKLGQKSVCRSLRGQARHAMKDCKFPGSMILYFLIFYCPSLFLFGRIVFRRLRKRKYVQNVLLFNRNSGKG